MFQQTEKASKSQKTLESLRRLRLFWCLKITNGVRKERKKRLLLLPEIRKHIGSWLEVNTMVYHYLEEKKKKKKKKGEDV